MTGFETAVLVLNILSYLAKSQILGAAFGFIYREYENWLTTKYAQLERDGRAQLETVGPAHNFLVSLYFDKFVKANPETRLLALFGRPLPAVAIPLPNSQPANPDALTTHGTTVDTPTDIAHFFIEKSQAYVDFTRMLRRPLNDRWTVYCLESLRREQPGTVGIKCSVRRYIESFRTGEYLDWEFVCALGRLARTGVVPSDIDLRHFPARQRLHAYDKALDAGNLLSTAGRAGGIGIAVTTLFRRADRDYVLMAKRSNSGVAVQTNQFHVVPSGMFQPVVHEREEFAISHTVFREYLEELFDDTELEDPTKYPAWDFFYDKDELIYLRHLISTGKAALYLTGVVVNLMNLRTEVCVLLHIGTEEWWELHKQGRSAVISTSEGERKLRLRRFKLNDEYDELDPLTRNKYAYELSELRQLSLGAHNMVVTGAASLSLGLEFAQNKGLIDGF